MTHGMKTRLPRAMALAALFIFPSSSLVILPAEEKPTEGKEPSASRDERLKELSRYVQETARLRGEGKIQEAIEACGKVLAIERDVFGDDHEAVAAPLEVLAELHEALGDFEAAEKDLREVLSIREKLHGKEQWRITDAKLDLEDLKRRSALNPEERSELMEAQKLNAQVFALWQKGRSSEALSLAERAAEIGKRLLGDESREYALSLFNLGAQYSATGNLRQAEGLYVQASEIWKKALGEGHPHYAVSLNNLAMLYQEMGYHARAEPLYRQALEIRKKVLGEEHPDYATSLNNLAMLYSAMGDYARAEPLYRQTLEIKDKVLGGEHPDYAMSLNNLAMLYSAMGDYARAEPLYRQALEIIEKVLGQEHPSYATSLDNIAGLYQHMGDYARAEPLHRKALEIKDKVLGGEHPDYAMSLNNLAMLYSAMGDYARAEPLYRQALDIWKKVLVEEHPYHAITLHHLAHLYQDLGDSPRAEPFMREALMIASKNLDLASSVQSERQQLAMSRSVRSALNCYLCFAQLAHVPADAIYGRVVAWKGTVFCRQRHMRLERKRPELTSLFSELESASSRLAALAFSVPDRKKRDTWSRQVSELTRRKEETEAELSRRSAEYGREKSLSRISVRELQSALPKETVLIDLIGYSRFSPRKDPPKLSGEETADRKRYLRRSQKGLSAFVLSTDAPVALVDLGASEPIEEAIGSWRSAILGGPGSKEETESAAFLRKHLWEPLEKHLAGRRVVLVSPDGALGRFPLGALPGSRPGTYLIEEVLIAILPVPQMLPDLLAGGKPSDATPSVLLVGDVDFDAGGSNLDAAAAQGTKEATSSKHSILRGEVREAPRGGTLLDFRPLDSTRGEILMVADTFEAACRGSKLSRLRGGDASEAAVREAAAKHEFIHLATHGFFAPEELKSALAPSKAEGMDRPDPGLGPGANVIGWHPGLLSGIVLAGANSRPDPERDDGILTALEVATLDLERTELMVLSACETGLGATAGGEGLLGLQRSAQMAGARTVIASLWKVDDIDTQALMARFYENLWKKEMGKLEALREAQLAMLHGDLGRGTGLIAPRPDAKPGRVPPRAWAAWVLSGDWR